MPSTPVDRGVGLTVTLAVPVNPDDGSATLPEPTLVVPLASVTRSVAPAQPALMPETVTLVIRPEVSIVAAKEKPSTSQRLTDAVPPPSGLAVVDRDAAEATPAAKSAPANPATTRARVRAPTGEWRPSCIA